MSASLLVGANRVGVLQRQRDIIETVGQTMFTKFVDIEVKRFTARRGNRLRRQIDGQTVTGRALRLVEQQIDRLFIESDRQKAVFKTVIEKDIGKARSNYRAKTIIIQRPDRVFA